jgi:hypothetical protein
MENELPKGETKVEEVIEAKKEVVAGGEVKKEEVSETVVIAEKNIVVEKLNALRVCIAKMSTPTKSFVVVLAVFAIVMAVAYYYKGFFIAATVNGSPVSRWSVVQELEKKGGKNILDTLITKKLIQDEVKKANIVVKNEEVDAEIKKIEAQVTAQGGTLEAALAGQGMTEQELREQVLINKEIEQILAEKIVVSDEEVNQYLTSTKSLPPKGKSSDDMIVQAREQLKGQKFNTEASKWVSDLKENAKIDYFTQY